MHFNDSKKIISTNVCGIFIVIHIGFLSLVVCKGEDIQNNKIYLNEIFNYVNSTYNIIEYMLYQREFGEFESLQNILAHVKHISPLCNHLLARCYIEVDQQKKLKIKMKITVK